MLNTINLEDTPSNVGIFRLASAQAFSGFTEKSTKLETPCEFFRKNKLRSFRYKVLKKGDIRLSFIMPDGKEFYAIQRNFSLAYIKLVRSFYSRKIELKDENDKRADC